MLHKVVKYNWHGHSYGMHCMPKKMVRWYLNRQLRLYKGLCIQHSYLLVTPQIKLMKLWCLPIHFRATNFYIRVSQSVSSLAVRASGLKSKYLSLHVDKSNYCIFCRNRCNTEVSKTLMKDLGSIQKLFFN